MLLFNFTCIYRYLKNKKNSVTRLTLRLVNVDNTHHRPGNVKVLRLIIAGKLTTQSVHRTVLGMLMANFHHPLEDNLVIVLELRLTNSIETRDIAQKLIVRVDAVLVVKGNRDIGVHL